VIRFHTLGNDLPAVAVGNVRYGVLDGLTNHGCDDRLSVFDRPTYVVLDEVDSVAGPLVVHHRILSSVIAAG